MSDMNTNHKMTSIERRAAVSLGTLFSLRILGLFMILPVFSLYAHQLEGNTPFLTGIAIGAYGLTQALLQIPFGMLSDRIGRKKIIIIGLLVFAAGSVLAALSTSIWGVIAGRALQGAGAIAAAVMALLADLTRDEHRSKAMAIFGGSIGMSFTLALIIGPVLYGLINVPGIFWLTGLLALSGIFITGFWVPTPEVSCFHQKKEPVLRQFKRVLSNTQLLRLDLGILTLHLIITANFVALPLVLQNRLGIPSAEHWWIYLLVLLIGVAGMVPLIFLAEKKHYQKIIFISAIFMLLVAEFGLSQFNNNLYQIIPFLAFFFIAFNTLEAMLPSLVSKTVPADSKGTAMGFYSSSQFMGAFLGGGLGGWVIGEYSLTAVFILCGISVIIWFVFAISMQPPISLRSHIVRVKELQHVTAHKLANQIKTIAGVKESFFAADEGVIYLKVDNNRFNEYILNSLVSAYKKYSNQ